MTTYHSLLERLVALSGHESEDARRCFRAEALRALDAHALQTRLHPAPVPTSKEVLSPPEESVSSPPSLPEGNVPPPPPSPHRLVQESLWRHIQEFLSDCARQTQDADLNRRAGLLRHRLALLDRLSSSQDASSVRPKCLP